MATVRFSKELISQIELIARGKMQPAIDKAKAAKPDNAWGQRIYDTLFADVKHLVQQLPAGWVNTVDRIRVSKVGSLACNIDFTLATPQPWPCRSIVNEYAIVDGDYVQDVTLRDHLIWGEFFAEVAAYRDRIVAAETRSKEFVEMVNKVCSAYTTLAPALKAWPPLWDLLPEDVKDKHREVKGREKKEVVLDVDLDKLTAISTAIKLSL